MKRILLVLGLISLLAAGLSAQDIDYADFADAFQTFADEVASTLPASAAVSGLNWSPAYIGQFPHFGVGVSVGAATIPYKVIKPLVGELGVTLPSEFEYLERWGMPIPGLALDARVGGFLFPFDVGFKFGFIPETLREKMGKVNADYLLVGGDIRVPLLKERGLLPTLSISGGYTFMRGTVGVPDIISDYEVDMTGYGPGLGIVKTTAPELTFTWRTHTFVGKLQASKKLLIFTPHLGLGTAYGVSSAGGGMSSDVLYDPDGGGPAPYATITQSEIDMIEAALTAAGEEVPDLSSDGILVTSDANGFSFWVYGGTAINIFFIKIDLSAMYNFLSGGYGGAVNVRLQL
jgi:hypothetical protein